MTSGVTVAAGVTAVSSSGGGGSGSISRSISSVSSNTNGAATANTDYVYFCTGTMTFTLPTAVGNTNRYTVKNVGTGVVTVASAGGTVDGLTTQTLNAKQSLDFVSDNTNWNIV